MPKLPMGYPGGQLVINKMLVRTADCKCRRKAYSLNGTVEFELSVEL